MTIEFDPRARGISQPAQSNETEAAGQNSRAQSGDFFDADPFAQQTISELDLLFSGALRFKQLRMENPAPSINIPGLDQDILGPMPILGSSARDLSEVIHRYEGLRRNLIERRRNYAHALESYLRPEEAFDLHQRLEEIDHSLIRVEQELSKAIRYKQQAETRERQEVEQRRQAEEDAEAEAIARWEEWTRSGG